MHPRMYNGVLHELRDLYTREEAELWMKSEHKLLNGRRPVDCHPNELWRLIDQLKSGIYL